MNKLTKAMLKQMLLDMYEQGLTSKCWSIEEEELVYIIKDVKKVYPIEPSHSIDNLFLPKEKPATLIITITKEFKVLEVRVIDNNMLQDFTHGLLTQKWTDIFQAALDGLQAGNIVWSDISKIARTKIQSSKEVTIKGWIIINLDGEFVWEGRTEIFTDKGEALSRIQEIKDQSVRDPLGNFSLSAGCRSEPELEAIPMKLTCDLSKFKGTDIQGESN